MKLYQQIICILLLLVSHVGRAQDLLITAEGDTLNCKITKIKSDYLYFTYVHKSETRNTLIQRDAVSQYELNYFSQSLVHESLVVNPFAYPHFRLALNGGYSYRIAPVSEDFDDWQKDYIQGLKKGYHLSIDASYFFSEYLGFGIKYSLNSSSNSLDNVTATFADGSVFTGTMSDDITIRYKALTFLSRLHQNSTNNTFILGLSIGSLSYLDESIFKNKLTYTGNTIGLGLDISYDRYLNKNLAIGFQLSTLSGTLFKYTVSDGENSEVIKLEPEQYENLNRIDFSVGLRFGW
jgi:hypothetical protein